MDILKSYNIVYQFFKCDMSLKSYKYPKMLAGFYPQIWGKLWAPEAGIGSKRGRKPSGGKAKAV
jgi:hypothetical protein